ncbi:putative U11/U12 small nuclear ribonucleoprotein 25kDa protein [Helianthus debilis subsp. tardiflorus]
MIMCLQIKKPTLSDVDNPDQLGTWECTSFDVAVMNSATVKDLKLAVEKKVNEIEQSKMGHRHISCISLMNRWLLVLDTNVAVMNSATVKDLKIAVEKKVNEMKQSKMGHQHISWEHVWQKH